MAIYTFPTNRMTPIDVDENGNCKCKIPGTVPGPHKWAVETIKIEAKTTEEAWKLALEKAKAEGFEIFYWPNKEES